MFTKRTALAVLVGLLIAAGPICRISTAEDSLIGYWKLDGDCRDWSGSQHHAVNHGVDLSTGTFDGRGSYLEVPDAPEFHWSSQPFSVAAWIHTEHDMNDVIGDIVSKYDPMQRNGFHISVGSSGSGYNSAGNTRHVHFAIDDRSPGNWIDCGRPGGKTNNSDALTVYQGHLYAGITDAPNEEDWAHVFRYQGEQEWEDCGRVGNGRTRGVYAMIVHDGHLYAATSASHGPQPSAMSFGRVYRYHGGQQWEDLGQPGSNYRLNSLASYEGKLYVCGFNIGPDPGHVYVYEGGTKWSECGQFNGWPHTLAVHDGKLFTAYPKGEVFAYDGTEWQNLGNPFESTEECNQIHSLGVYQGELYAGTWPKGKIAVLRDGRWHDRGRLGDATEIIALTIYNGSFYAGTIPRAEVFRADTRDWTSVHRLFDPPDFAPVPVGSGDAQGVADWSRTTSMAVFAGKLFVSTGTCYRTMMEHPRDNEIRGRVFAFQSGANVTYDADIGPGWKHIAAIRDGEHLHIYVNGEQCASSRGQPLQVSNDQPLKIGFGQGSHFCGKMRSVRLYNRALKDEEVKSLLQQNDRPSD